MSKLDGRSGRLPVSRRRALPTGVFGSAAVMVGGGFIRSQAGKTGAVTVTAAHATLGWSSVLVTITPVARTGSADDGPKTTE
jgi:hypothetical protein